MAEYSLSCVLDGHTNDVRCVATSPQHPGWIFSGSRDGTARLWVLDWSSGWEQKTLFKGHKGFVNCMAFSSADEQYKHGILYTGCQDGKIRVYEPDAPDPLAVLDAHTDNVASLFVSSKSKTLLSASWDGTAKVWLNNKAVMTLKGHAAGVWCAVIVNSRSLMVTGSADATIKVWKGGQCQTTLKGEFSQPVRDLALVGDDGFLSCSNDGQIIMWKFPSDVNATTPTVVFKDQGPDYIYSLAELVGLGGFAACGENFGIKVFKGDGKLGQNIPVPAISVWSVAFMEDNGDVVAGASDNKVYIFTKEEARMAPHELMASYLTDVETFVKGALTNGSNGELPEEIGGVKTSDIPGPEALQRPGQREGQTKMIRQGKNVSVHSWSASDQQWTKIGDVVGEPDKSDDKPAGLSMGKTMYEGKEYDHVFHIDIDEGVVLKLPYNNTEEPYVAAQSFIHKHNLPQEYLDQVANFIIKNTPERRNGGDSAMGMACDPFTGSGAYVSGSGGHTGGGGGMDPFTGAGAYTTTAAQPSYFPQTELLTFSNVPNFEALAKKLAVCNSSVDEPSRLSPEQLQRLAALGDSDTVTPTDIPLLLKALKWPKVLDVNPALDVTRLILLKSSFAAVVGSSESVVGELVDVVISHVASPQHPKNQMLALKVLVNLFGVGRQLLVQFSEVILKHISALLPTDNKVTQVSIATLVLNYAVTSTSSSSPDQTAQRIQGECLNLVVLLLESLTDPEAKFRALVALGTVVDAGAQDSRALAKSLDLRERVQTAKMFDQGQEKIVNISSSLLNLM